MIRGHPRPHAAARPGQPGSPQRRSPQRTAHLSAESAFLQAPVGPKCIPLKHGSAPRAPPAHRVHPGGLLFHPHKCDASASWQSPSFDQARLPARPEYRKRRYQFLAPDQPQTDYATLLIDSPGPCDPAAPDGPWWGRPGGPSLSRSSKHRAADQRLSPTRGEPH